MSEINFPSTIHLTNTENTNKVSLKSTNITITKNGIESDGNIGQVLGKTGDNSLNWITAAPVVTTKQYNLSLNNTFFLFPPLFPPNNIYATYRYDGWYFQNGLADRKIDWFFAPDNNMIVDDVKGLYLNYFNVTALTKEHLPFISIYTKPTGLNDYSPGVAHSIMTYVPEFTPVANVPYNSFANISGEQPNPFSYGHELQQMLAKIGHPLGEYLPNEQIQAIVVGTTAANPVMTTTFVLSKVGICLAQGNFENVCNATPFNLFKSQNFWEESNTFMKPILISNLISSYNIDTGTGVVNSFGYCYRADVPVSGSITASSTVTIATLLNIPMGIYMVSLGVSITPEVNLSVVNQQLRIFASVVQSPNVAVNGNVFPQNSILDANIANTIGLSGIWVNTQTQNLSATFLYNLVVSTTGTYKWSGQLGRNKFTAVRIA